MLHTSERQKKREKNMRSSNKKNSGRGNKAIFKTMDCEAMFNLSYSRDAKSSGVMPR